jgi:hypothetical protein
MAAEIAKIAAPGLAREASEIIATPCGKSASVVGVAAIIIAATLNREC